MAVCRFFMEGRCRYGDQCWNEHPRGGRNQNQNQNQSSRGGSVNRVWVNPNQRSGGGVLQPSSFSGGQDWNSGAGRDVRGSDFSQNRFSSLNTTHSTYGGAGGGDAGGGGAGAGHDRDIEAIQKDMEAWQDSGQWIFSCYSLLKASISGFVELSPEELRMEYYTSRTSGNLQSYVNSVQQLFNQWRSRVQELRTMNPNTRSAMLAELSNPTAQPASDGFFSSSASSTGFGSSAGFGSAPSTGFGAAPSSGFGAASSSGFGSTSATGFGSSGGFGESGTSTGFGSSTASGLQGGGFGSSSQSGAAGFSFAPPSAGFGSSSAQPASSQFGSPAPSASSFSFTAPANQTPAAGFSFTPSGGGGGGFGGSSTPAGGTAPSSGGGGGFGGFGGAVGVSAGMRSSGGGGGDSVFTPQSELTPDELREFSAKRFTLGQIPLRAPPAELLSV